MSTETVRPALRAALYALAPTLGVQTTAIPQITDQLAQAVGQDSFGGFVITTGAHAGRDLADYVQGVLRHTNPNYFVAAVTPAKSKRDVSRMTATERLAVSNGDTGPKL